MELGLNWGVSCLSIGIVFGVNLCPVILFLALTLRTAEGVSVSGGVSASRGNK
ncbi:hypothetical protein BDW42DRAFT_166615 [Aspergillus taichungensis]|uniref:Uncharacterized protein n=1 Tax=Aspergillus taichungensis TaxID=482145 RepID=A0A2J5HYY6_9EURO|nr:hypothetical protein BDW42DRAFT_166615 [Aspergillus taichungensis]